MAAFSVHILGCGSALPTTHHHPSSQVIDLRDKLYMIDCGEGVQRQFRHEKLHFGRLIHIFISHLHGDHCFGLPGFISTLGLLGRTGTLHVHGPEGIERFLSPILEQFCHRMPYQVEIHTIDASRHALVHEDKSVKVYSIPLSHRIPAVGYLFEEKCRARHLNKAAAEFYNIPLAEYPLIIEGSDYTTPDGRIIPNRHLTTSGTPPRRYAYCSDTEFCPSIVPIIQGVDLLYHEATFMEEDRARAKETFHSTAKEAAEIARQAGAKRLLIGHYSGRYKDVQGLLEEAQSIFKPTIAANERMRIDL